MTTKFKVVISHSDFLNDYKKYLKASFLVPDGYDTILDFKNYVSERPGDMKIYSFSFNEFLTFNLGDKVLLNHIYYRVSNKIFIANYDEIVYELTYE